jgi:hypothetical protein
MWAQVWSLFEGILYLLLHEAGDESMFNSLQSSGVTKYVSVPSAFVAP